MIRIFVAVAILLVAAGCLPWFQTAKAPTLPEPAPVSASPQKQNIIQHEEISSVTFSIITPDTAKAGEAFPLKVVAKDTYGVVITDYNRIGSDVVLSTTGTGTITPGLIGPALFKDGVATVNCIYDKTESFDIIARSEATSLKRRYELVTEQKEQAVERKEPSPERKEYVIDEEDQLSISVWGWDDLKGEVIVRPDGKISFPLIGDVQAKGLTLTELDDEVTRRLAEYVKDPEVSIMLRKYGGKKVIVLGEVNDPGVYRTTGRNTISEVIALAGGYTDDAYLPSVILVRGGIQDPHAQRVNITRLLKKGDTKQNVAVQPEDIVYVPKNFVANLNYFIDLLTPAVEKADMYYTWEEW